MIETIPTNVPHQLDRLGAESFVPVTKAVVDRSHHLLHSWQLEFVFVFVLVLYLYLYFVLVIVQPACICTLFFVFVLVLVIVQPASPHLTAGISHILNKIPRLSKSPHLIA